MRTTLMTLVGLAMLVSITTAMAQTTYDMQGPPKVLNIYREYVKVGKDYGHDQHEAAWLQAMRKADYNTFSLTVTAITGEPEEWFMNGFNNFAAWEKDQQRLGNPALAKVMADYAAKDGDYINTGRRIVAEYRPDLSYKPDFRIGEYKYFEIINVRYRLGIDPEETVKILNDAYEKFKMDIHREVYQVTSGAPFGTYLVLIPLQSEADWDRPDPPGFAEALKASHLGEAMAKNIMNIESRLFAFNPQLSNVPDAVASLDPAFWRPTRAAAKAPVKPTTPAAKKESAPRKP